VLRAAVLILALSGCSFVVTSAPPPVSPPPTSYPNCTESLLPEIVDGAIAIFATAGAIYFFETRDEMAGVLVESGIAIGFGASALTTIARPWRCGAARAAFWAHAGPPPAR
jgi:hypothetical protein